MTEKQMWNEYSRVNPSAENYDAWSFGGNSPEMPNILADLVRTGVKTATASAYPCYLAENLPMPGIGTYHIILNTRSEAVCIIRTTKAYIVPFCEVSSEHAYKEGEFDRTLQSWRDCHSEIFTAELKELGQEFTEKMLVVCEEFEVVYPEK